MLHDAAIERLYDLNVGTTPLLDGPPHEKPHKPLPLVAAFDLTDKGLAAPDPIPWCQAIRDRFTARFNLVRKHNDHINPYIPFRNITGDRYWKPVEADGEIPCVVIFESGSASVQQPSAVSTSRSASSRITLLPATSTRTPAPTS